MTDHELLKLMLHHIQDLGNHRTPENLDICQHRRRIIECEMADRELRREVYRTLIQVSQHVRLAVGRCGHGEEARLVESGFDVVAGDQMVVYREK